MNKFENVDIIGSLAQIMDTNTRHYQTDFVYDREFIQKSAQSENPQDKHLIFISRPCGTYSFHTADVFMKDTAPYTTCKFYIEQESSDILFYGVEIKGEENGVIMGNLYELDFKEHFKRIEKNAVRTAKYLVHYEHGDREVDFGKSFTGETYGNLGKFLTFDYIPTDAEQLKAVLQSEYKSYEKLKTGDISKHITALQNSAVKRRLSEMTDEEKQAHIGMVEISRDYGDTGGLTQFDIALYDAATAEREKKKPSIRRQLAENKTRTAEPNKEKSIKKEDLSL